MKRYELTEEEKTIVTKYCNYRIPYIFRAGVYCTYMLYFELIYEICESLLKGRRIDEKIYKNIIEGTDIKKENLDSCALEFFNLYLQIENLVKKYHVGDYMNSIEKSIVKSFLKIEIPMDFLNSTDKLLFNEHFINETSIFIKTSFINRESIGKIISLKNSLFNDVNFQSNENMVYFDFMRLVIAIMRKYSSL